MIIIIIIISFKKPQQQYNKNEQSRQGCFCDEVTRAPLAVWIVCRCFFFPESGGDDSGDPRAVQYRYQICCCSKAGVYRRQMYSCFNCIVVSELLLHQWYYCFDCFVVSKVLLCQTCLIVCYQTCCGFRFIVPWGVRYGSKYMGRYQLCLNERPLSLAARRTLWGCSVRLPAMGLNM